MATEIIIAIFGAAALVLATAAIWISLRSGRKEKPDSEGAGLALLQQQVESLRNALESGQRESLRLMNEQLAHITANFSSRLDENARAVERAGKTIGERMDGAARVVGEVQQSLARLDEANKRIYEIGKDIAGLEQLLKMPKLRGGLGEFFLEDLLAQIMPSDCFCMQHEFKSKKKVDAVIRIGDKYVSIDAKFPMESFRRMVEANNETDQKRSAREFSAAVKKQVEEITSSYIIPEEGTYDFALMYIPAENIYYETVIKSGFGDEDSIASYALKRRVIPVSPNNLYAYLQTIIMGLKGMHIEKRAEEVIRQLGGLKKEFDKFAKEFQVLGKHLASAKGKYEESEKIMGKFNDKLEQASQLDAIEEGEEGAGAIAGPDENSSP